MAEINALQRQFEAFEQECTLWALRIERYSEQQFETMDRPPKQLDFLPDDPFFKPTIVAKTPRSHGMRLSPATTRPGQLLHVHMFLLCDEPADKAEKLRRRFSTLTREALRHRPNQSLFPACSPIDDWLDVLFTCSSGVQWGIVGGAAGTGSLGCMIDRRQTGIWQWRSEVPHQLRRYYAELEHVEVSGNPDVDSQRRKEASDQARVQEANQDNERIDQVYSIIFNVALTSSQLLATAESEPSRDDYLSVSEARDRYIAEEIEYEADPDKVKSRIHRACRGKKPHIRSAKSGDQTLVHYGDFLNWMWKQRKKILKQFK
jgi:hypothetical protein